MNRKPPFICPPELAEEYRREQKATQEYEEIAMSPASAAGLTSRPDKPRWETEIDKMEEDEKHTGNRYDEDGR